MRHQFTTIFRDFLTSSLWAADPPTRCVWIWFLLTSDPEGYVVGTAPGVAQQAGVTLEQARAAIALLEAPDPDSSSTALDGRRIVKVDRGWHIVNFIAYRELAKAEADKARKRQWAAVNRARGSQLTLPHVSLNPAPMEIVEDASCVDESGRTVAGRGRTVADSSETLDAPIPKPIPIPKGERGTPLPPVVSNAFEQQLALANRRSQHPEERMTFDAPVVPTVYRTLEGWELSSELRSEAVLAGIEPSAIDTHIADLRNGPIGGSRGVIDRDQYVRSQFPKWRAWEEERKLKAQRSAATGPSRRFGNEQAAPEGPTRARVLGAPAWVYEEHANFSKEAGLDLPRACRAYARQSHIAPSALKPADVFEPFMLYLQGLAREKFNPSPGDAA